MKNILFFMIVFITSNIRLYGQGENNIWTFAAVASGSNLVLNFNQNPVGLSTITPAAYDESYGTAVCFPNGQLRFSVRLSDNPPGTMTPNIFTAAGVAIANSNLLTGTVTARFMPVVIPMPGNPDQYYIFYTYSNGLLYSLLDMSLNNGSGGIISGQKDIILSPYGTVMGQKMTAVKGCDGVWLVVRNRIANGYLSFHVTSAGVNNSAVESPTNNFSLYDYNTANYGSLKASPEGEKIAICGWFGVELYDFEKCSGKVLNGRILEATGNAPFNQQNIFNHYRYQDVCFSPDGSKLYTTMNQVDSSFIPSQNLPGGFITQGGSGMLKAGKLYQFDLNQPNTTAIIASKTLIMTNQPSIVPYFTSCIQISQNPLGEMKLGSDGKIYIDNGSITCLNPSAVPAGYNPGPAFHTINQPNILGLLCLPQFNTVVVEGFSGNYDRTFYGSGDGGSSYLPRDVVIAPPLPDTIAGLVYYPVACFSDSILLTANSAGSCYLWDDSSTDQTRTIHQSGIYYVRYFKDCSVTTDTFHVNLIHIPAILESNKNCPGMHLGKLIVQMDSSNSIQLQYVWRSSDGSIIRQHTGTLSDTLSGLEAGNYVVEISTNSGCNVTLTGTITDLPQPDISVSPTDTTIRYGDSIILQAFGALFYAWSPSASLDSATKANPMAKPLQPTLYSVIGIAENGCRDTAFAKVDIDYTMPGFIPNAFSPNGDGLNDVFGINITYQKVIQFKIFNRYGQDIFSTMDGRKGWDGTFKGNICDVGTYYYFIVLDYPDGNQKTYKGDVTLIR